jgi:hypothetical protein
MANQKEINVSGNAEVVASTLTVDHLIIDFGGAPDQGKWHLNLLALLLDVLSC